MKGLILIFVLLSYIFRYRSRKALVGQELPMDGRPIQAVICSCFQDKQEVHQGGRVCFGRTKEGCLAFLRIQKQSLQRIREGLHTSFYANGKDSPTEVYRDNRLEGQTMVYYPDGAIHLARSYSDGKLDGTLLQYYPDGKLVERNTIQRISVPVERCSTSTELKWNISRISCFHPSPVE